MSASTLRSFNLLCCLLVLDASRFAARAHLPLYVSFMVVRPDFHGVHERHGALDHRLDFVLLRPVLAHTALKVRDGGHAGPSEKDVMHVLRLAPRVVDGPQFVHAHRREALAVREGGDEGVVHARCVFFLRHHVGGVRFLGVGVVVDLLVVHVREEKAKQVRRLRNADVFQIELREFHGENSVGNRNVIPN